MTISTTQVNSGFSLPEYSSDKRLSTNYVFKRMSCLMFISDLSDPFMKFETDAIEVEKTIMMGSGPD